MNLVLLATLQLNIETTSEVGLPRGRRRKETKEIKLEASLREIPSRFWEPTILLS